MDLIEMETDSNGHMTSGFWPNFGEDLLNPATGPPQYNFAPTVQSSVVMDPGYKVLRNVIPEAQALELAETIPVSQPPLQIVEKISVYPATLPAKEIYRESVKGELFKACPELAAMPAEPPICFGVFRPKEPFPDPTIPTAQGYFCYILALSHLNKENGMFTILEGSHKKSGDVPKSEWNEKSIELFPGDSIIWRSDVATRESGGGDGRFIYISFPMKAEQQC